MATKDSDVQMPFRLPAKLRQQFRKQVRVNFGPRAESATIRELIRGFLDGRYQIKQLPREPVREK